MEHWQILFSPKNLNTMALMDYIDRPVKKTLPTEEDIIAATEAQDNTGSNAPVAEIQEQKVMEPLKAPEIPSVPVKPASLNWMSDDEYKEVSKYIPPERINQIYNGFDAKSSEPLYETLYKATHKAPEIPDERKEKAARTVAGVTDALKTLIQGVAGFKGAYIPKDDRPGALESVSKEQQRLKDIYKTDRERYDAGLYQSTLADLEAARKGYNTDRATLLNVLNNLRTQGLQRDINDAKLKYQAEKDRLAREERGRRDAATADYRKQSLEIGRMNAAANMTRANNSGSSSRSTNKGEIEFFDANTGTTYKVNEKKFKYNAPQMFEILKDDILANDEKLNKQYRRAKGKITLQEREDAVKRYMYDNPEAMKFLGEISNSIERNISPKVSDSGEKKQDDEPGQAKLDISQFERKSADMDDIPNDSASDQVSAIDYSNLQRELDNAGLQKKAKAIQYLDERMKDARASLDMPMYFPTESTTIRR